MRSRVAFRGRRRATSAVAALQDRRPRRSHREPGRHDALLGRIGQLEKTDVAWETRSFQPIRAGWHVAIVTREARRARREPAARHGSIGPDFVQRPREAVESHEPPVVRGAVDANGRLIAFADESSIVPILEGVERFSKGPSRSLNIGARHLPCGTERRG